MTPRWLLRYAARLDVVAMRLGYLAAGPEHRQWATFEWVDDDFTYRCSPLLPSNAGQWLEQEWQRTDGQPASALD